LGVKREEIFEKLESFHVSLIHLRGPGGRAVEKQIVKNLCQRLGLKYEDREWGFIDYVRFAEEIYQRAILGRGDLLNFISNVRARDHFMIVYDGLEDKHLGAFAYLKVGLDQGEAGIYIAGEEKPEQVRQAMRESNVDVDAYERDGRLRIVDCSHWYFTDGKVDASEIIARWKNGYDESKSNGWRGLRAVGEMDCFIKHNLLSELVDYEKTLGTPLQIPIAGMCIINSNTIKMMEREPLLALVKAHGSTTFL